MVYHSLNQFKFDIDWKFIVKCIISSMIMSIIIIYIKPLGNSEVIFTLLFSILIYIILLFTLGLFNKNEINFIKNSFLKKRNV